MASEIRVPTLGESVTEATVGKWFKKAGDAVDADEPLVELETDKVTVEVPAPTSGVLAEIVAQQGETVAPGALLGSISEGDGKAAPSKPADESERARPAKPAAAAPAATPAATAKAPSQQPAAAAAQPLSPAVRKMVAEHALDPAQIKGSGKGGRILKEDVLAAVAKSARADTQAPAEPAGARAVPQVRAPVPVEDEAREERVRMTRLRQTIARRLKEAQNTAAMLTTFNEADMSAIMQLRRAYREAFEKRHGVRLGFMSFFVKACCQALKDVPEVNAEIDGEDIVYKNYYHIGIAVGTERGLVVPVLREADRMSLAEIERAIADFAIRAREGRLGIEDMQGGTFTITNGGIYGSLNSTPILNAPQSGILGMHKIQDRPVAIDGQVVIRPMMYLALSYDHRVVDGQGAVTFLVRVKECLEDPARLVLEL